MLQVGARADVHVDAADDDLMTGGHFQAQTDLLVPDAVLRLIAAGVRLAAVTVAEARVDAERDLSAGGAAAEVLDHVGRAAVYMDVALHAEVKGLGVEDVGRVDDRRRRAFDRVAGRQRTADLARAHGIDQGPMAAKQIQHGQVRTCLLGIAHVVEGRQIGKPLEDHGRIVHERRRAELPGQILHGDPGDVRSRGGRNSGSRGGHRRATNKASQDRRGCRSWRGLWLFGVPCGRHPKRAS